MSAAKLPAMPKQLPAVSTNGQLPVVAKATTRPLRALNDFADRAEDLAAYMNRLDRARKEILRITLYSPAEAQKHLDQASTVLAQFDKTYGELAKELTLDRVKFNPLDAYDKDGKITETRVRQHMALLSCYSNANPANPEAYVGMMVEEVMAECPVLVVLESACSQLRRTLKFLPAISKVIEAIEEQDELWTPRLSAIDECAETVRFLRGEVKIATDVVATNQAKLEEQQLAAEQKKRTDDELRAKPLGIGDRVRNRKQYHRMGTITAENGGSLQVMSDELYAVWIAGDEIERAIPSDYGSEIAPDKRAAVSRRVQLYQEIEERQRLRRLRPVVGDRVSYAWYDYEGDSQTVIWIGTVLFAGDFEPGRYDDGFTIQFDNGTLGENFMAIQLSRLLPGDPGFEKLSTTATSASV
jgi:hypothetical protein